MRRLVVWLVGVGIAVSAAAPAAATVRDPGIATAGSVAAESFSPVDLGWSPSNDEPARPATAATSPRATPATPDRAAQVPHQAGSVRVVSGDTLWDIAAQTLPKNASDAQITEQWHRWYEANRDVIGSDPDLILPGQVLHPPG
ncbi:MAG: hypothetical protein CSA58_11235 [Micrococcales bacterium]|nr:MAG: hypothetical protein CSA58_11235 [Micrococcales bacterium]